jgi:hypothetical protein
MIEQVNSREREILRKQQIEEKWKRTTILHPPQMSHLINNTRPLIFLIEEFLRLSDVSDVESEQKSFRSSTNKIRGNEM